MTFRLRAEWVHSLKEKRMIGHQIGAFASASLGGIFVDKGWGYAPLWVMNLILAGIAAAASYAIREPGRK